MDAYIGAIKMLAGNTVPRGWALCDGQILKIYEHSALHSVIKEIYGGDGRSTFALPDMRGRVPMHWGSGHGVTKRELGKRFGKETATIGIPELYKHDHNAWGTIQANSAAGDQRVPKNFNLASGNKQYTTKINNTSMADGNVDVTVENTGGNLPIPTLGPISVIRFVICMAGVFPPPSE